jgi:F-type H+-transporting ATPase subunit c
LLPRWRYRSAQSVRRSARDGAVAAAMDAIARQTLFVGLAMIDTMAIYCLVIALLVLFANPFIH